MAAKDLVINLLAHDKASAEIKKVGSSLSGLEKQQKGLNSAASALGAVGLAAFAASSIQAFAQVQDASSALAATYGTSAKAFEEFANTQADAFNLSKREALAAQQTFANFASAAGLSGTKLETFTVDLTKRAADMASYFGGSTTEAISAISSALMGESEPIRKYGVLLDDASMRAKALEMGLISTTKDALTPQNKVLAANALILEKTSKAQGDVSRTSDSMANAIKDAQQQFDDFQVIVGETLAVAAGPLLKALSGVLSAFSNLPGPIKTVAVGLGLVAAAALLLGPRIFAVVNGFKAMIPAATQATGALTAEATAATAAGTATNGAATGIKALAVGIGGVLAVATSAALVIVGLGKAASLVEQAFGRGAQSAESFGASFRDGMSPEQMLKVKEAMNQVAGQSGILGVAVRGASGDIIGATKDFFSAGDELKNFDTSLATLVGSGNAAQAAGYLSAMGISAEEAAAKLPLYSAALDASAASADAAGGAAADLGDNFNAASRDTADFAKNTLKAVTQADALKFAADGLKAALDALGGKAMSVDEATSNLYGTFRDAKSTIAAAIKDTDKSTDAVTNQGKALDLTTEAGSKAQGALAAIAKSSDDMTVAYKAAGRSTEDVTAMQKKAYDAFVASAKSAGLSKDAAKALARQYGLIPPTAKTIIEASGIDDAKRAVLIYRLSLLDIPPERRTQIVTEWVTEGSKPAHPPIVATPLHPASGGFISGPGSGTSDSIPAMLSNGEYVVRASSVQRLGVPFLHSLNRYADGGLVTTGAASLTPAQLLAKFVRDTATAIRLEQGLMKLREDMAAQSRDTKNSVKSFASLTNSFDTKAYATAKADVATARARLNSAATPAERTAALADLDQAQAAARNSKPTAGNVIAGLKAKMNVIKSFGKNLRTLAKNGLPSSFLQQLIDAGPEEGGDLAKALLDSSPAQMKELAAIQRTIDRESGRIGNQRAHSEYDPLISKQRGLVDAAVARAGADRETLTTQVIVKLDGKEVATALAEYKRSIGGRKLGLD